MIKTDNENLNEKEILKEEIESKAEGNVKEESERGEKAENVEDESLDNKEETKEAEKNDTEDESTRYMRLMADFQNYKKRVEKQRSETFAFANEKIMLKLLDVLDNFERGLEADPEKEGFKEGMEMILKQLKDVLTENGLSEIESENEEFDPNLHNAVLMEEVESVESGKVSGVLQKGYSLNGKVIRPAMVKVAK